MLEEHEKKSILQRQLKLGVKLIRIKALGDGSRKTPQHVPVEKQDSSTFTAV
jgi:hypothetical protein